MQSAHPQKPLLTAGDAESIARRLFLAGETVFQGLSLYVDLFSFQIVGFATADANGDFAFPTMSFPANPAFASADLVYQAASIAPTGLFKSRVTNALYMNVDLF